MTAEGLRPAGAPAQGYVIGITVFVNADGRLALFENGLRQNVLFLYHLFAAAPGCAAVYLLNHGDGEPADPLEEAGIPAASLVRTAEVIDRLDYVISAGAMMDGGTIAALKARKVPVIAYKCGNGAVISMEAMCAHPPRGDAERYLDAGYYDAVWMTPQHLPTFRGWAETVYRCPVEEVPHIWSRFFVYRRPDDVRARFGYRPGKRPWRVGILDPNITVMKTSHLPMLVCEAAFRTAPENFAAIYVGNGQAHAQSPHFNAFFNAMSAAQAGVMTAEPRFVGIDLIANHTDAVVTHQWENGLNYLYYEVLAGDYPLVHNSPFLKDHGYYYADFDAEDGGAALLRAMKRHDRDIDNHRARTAALFATLDPAAPANIARHEALLERAKARAG